MPITTMQLDTRLRDELARTATDDYGGVPLAEALRQLLMEHKIARVMVRYEELRGDRQEWASYRAETRLSDNVAGEHLPGAREEYPEYNE